MAKKKKKATSEELPSLPPQKSKLEKKKENILKVTEQFLFGKQYRPLTFQEIAEKLSILEEQIPLFKDILSELINSNKVIVKQERYFPTFTPSPPSKQEHPADIVRGVIRINPRGFGFVEAEDVFRFPEDIFIPKQFTKNSIDGDTVEVLVSPTSMSDKGPEGKIVSILERSRTHLAGIVMHVYGQKAHVHVSILGQDQPALMDIPTDEKIIVGDRVSMKVLNWGDELDETHCELAHKIGHISDPKSDIPAAIEEFEIRSDFPQEAIEEAKKLGKTVLKKAFKDREDLTKIETFTIDPDTAKDFDDAVSLSKDRTGHYHLAVHIADVSHYVTPGSALDIEAYLRSNSTYFPGICVPMLPGVLSENLCSLKPKVYRLTVSVFMDFDHTGELLNYRIARTVIKSAKRYTYKEAKKILDGKLKSPHAATMHLMVELCGLLKKKRYHRGSVEFAMPELVVLVNTEGKPTGTDYIEYDVTHQLIEEFMLKSNEVVALHLDKQGKGLPFRVHDVPSEDNMRDFSILAQAFGFKLPNIPSPQDIQKLFEEAMSTPYGQYLATSYIRRMRLAVYSPVNIGHFGLSLTHYCHFTSPIRRYVDLVAHRLLFEPPKDLPALQKIADRCSERERLSAKAEGSVVLLKKYRLLEQYLKEDRFRQYEAVITRVKPFGIFFEIMELMLEGFIHISELGTDYYEFEERNQRLVGSRRGELFASGDKILVMLKDLLLITCESTWEIVSQEARKKPKKSVNEKKHGSKYPKERNRGKKGRSRRR